MTKKDKDKDKNKDSVTILTKWRTQKLQQLQTRQVTAKQCLCHYET